MAAPVLNAKFLRSFFIPAGYGTNGCMGWIHRLVYEFWGFCVNGDNNLSRPGPGSLANSQLTGSYLNMPVGWESGSLVLASGSDGTTSAGLPYFNVTGSQPFAPTMVGKWLTMWQSGSLSTDDSIYYISTWLNSSSIMLDPTYGGTSVGPSGSVPQLTSRSNINYRVIDYTQVATMAYDQTMYMVLQFPRANQINPGQAQSQAKIGAGSFFTQLAITLSSSGSWDGTHFVGLGELNQAITSEQGAGPGSGGWGTPDWFHNSGGGRGWVTIIAGVGFIICHAGSDSSGFMPNGASAYQIEVPTRLYPQANDPNPICMMNFGNLGVFTGAQVGYGFSHRWFPSPYDTAVRRWPILTPCYQGAYFNQNQWNGSNQQGLVIARWPLMYFNQPQSKFLMADGTLALAYVNGQGFATGNFSLSRARIRSTRYIPGGYPYYMRVGDNPDRWIHVGGGVLWPWDHAILIRPLFAGF